MSSAIDPTNPTEGTATTESVRDNFQAAKNEIEALQDSITGWQAAYPVGSIYINSTTADPNDFMGFGTWTAFGLGKVLVGFHSSETEFDTLEETGGEKTHTLTTAELASHNHTQDAHTHTQNSHNHTQDAHSHTQDAHTHTQNSHNHTQDTHNHRERCSTAVNANLNGASSGTNANSILQSVGASFTAGGGALNTGDTTATNQATTATNQNTTATNQNTTATNQNTTATNQNTTATNQATGGDGAHNNLQPYIVVNFWKRTA